MLDFLTLVMALVALIAAFKAFNQVAVLRARLEAMTAEAFAAGGGVFEITRDAGFLVARKT